MTVKTYNPGNALPVTFTDAAKQHLSKQVKSKGAKGIEFSVKESGCSGYKYLLELAFEIDADTLSYQLDSSLELFISPQVLPLLSGTQVDYIKQGVNYRLSFTNPNATALCGCGESFSVEAQEQN